MKLLSGLKLKSMVMPALAALVLTGASFGCKSTEDGASPDAAIEQVDGENVVDGENGEVNSSGEINSAEGNNFAFNNENPAAGNEIQNMVNDSSADAAVAPANGEMAATSNVDPFAAPMNNGEYAEVPTAPIPPALNNFNSPSADLGAGAAPADTMANETMATGDNANDYAYDNPVNADPFASANNTAGNNFAPVQDNASTSNNYAPSNVASTPSVGVVPEKGSKMAYYIQRGDTLALIAGKIYGSMNSWQQLAQENNLLNPSKIYAGDVLFYTLSDKSAGFAEKYENAPRKTVTVSAGDSLSKIAGQLFGSQSEWRTLWKENPQVKNPDQIHAGMVLTFRDFGTSVAMNYEEASMVAEEDFDYAEQD